MSPEEILSGQRTPCSDLSDLDLLIGHCTGPLAGVEISPSRVLKVTGRYLDPRPVVPSNASRPMFSIKSALDFTEAVLSHCWSDWTECPRQKPVEKSLIP